MTAVRGLTQRCLEMNLSASVISCRQLKIFLATRGTVFFSSRTPVFALLWCCIYTTANQIRTRLSAVHRQSPEKQTFPLFCSLSPTLPSVTWPCLRPRRSRQRRKRPPTILAILNTKRCTESWFYPLPSAPLQGCLPNLIPDKYHDDFYPSPKIRMTQRAPPAGDLYLRPPQKHQLITATRKWYKSHRVCCYAV